MCQMGGSNSKNSLYFDCYSNLFVFNPKNAFHILTASMFGTNNPLKSLF